MKWRKRGHIYAPDGSRPWARQYAFPPTPLRIDDELIRVYVAFCDEHTVGRGGYVDVRAANPSEVVRVSQEPVLDIGEPGCFDDNGVVPVSVLAVGDEIFLYYTGYQLGTDVSYFQFLGLAISRDGGESFERHSQAPVLEPSDDEPFTRASAHVFRSGEGFGMYYSGGDRWTEHEGKPLPVYNLRRLDSPDGKRWGPAGRVVVDLADDDEHAIARPWLLPGDAHRMLYSVRTRSNRDYRIGLAVSADGVEWERRDGEAGIDVSEGGWDSEAVAYASVAEHGDSTYLFYCGNQRGKTGFGYAELDQR